MFTSALMQSQESGHPRADQPIKGDVASPLVKAVTSRADHRRNVQGQSLTLAIREDVVQRTTERTQNRTGACRAVRVRLTGNERDRFQQTHARLRIIVCAPVEGNGSRVDDGHDASPIS
jgi:hypothetical protein